MRILASERALRISVGLFLTACGAAFIYLAWLGAGIDQYPNQIVLVATVACVGCGAVGIGLAIVWEAIKWY